MGFITNQWLKGKAERNRKWGPVEVTVVPEAAEGDWDSEHGVVAGVKAARPNADYQITLFTQGDLEIFLPHLVANANVETQQFVVHDILSRLSDTQLVALLSDFFAKRSKK